MREFRFDFNHNIPRGRVVMHVVNTGRLAHRLSLVYVPKDFPPILRQLNGTERRNVDTLAAIPNRPPHAKDTFSVDLDPGRWAFICYRVEPDGTAHWQKGMAEEFIVP